MQKSFAALLLSACGQLASANVFLAKGMGRETEMLNESTVKERLLEEVYGFMGRGTVDLQLPAINKALEPMWHTLPKNGHGNLDSDQVRYALHRFFVQRHGWRLDGLERMGKAGSGLRTGSEANPTGLIREHVPAFLMEVFEEAFGKTGLRQHELSIFAATLEHIIHDEASSRLTHVYEALNWSTQDALSVDELDTAADAYMMSLLLGLKRLQTPGSMDYKLQRLAKAYPAWPETQLFLRDVRLTVEHLEEGTTNPFSPREGYNFGQVERVVEEVSQRFGRFQDAECRQLKDTLLEAEEGSTGRVKLSDFYKKGLETKALFKESVDYLREQGALDETKAGEPRVIVSNFVLSAGNCLADTGLYSICCINECEGLLGEIEREVSAPDASPEQLVEIVERLSSSTVEAPRQLPERLVSQIELVAMRHGGRVPLHSRSLAQWLHIAFPHECPYPHAAASQSSKTTSELKATYQKSKLNVEQREQYIGATAAETSEEASSEEMSKEAEEELLSQWSHEEEILYHSEDQRRSTGGFRKLLGNGVLAIVLLAVGAAGVDVLRRGRGVSSLRPEKVHLV
eukprot:TRINITY_DN928_c1_g1_i7.p1 TRINITY_DN928_c1_g1~~TRINITY_DN928_c1_g1_i7.p1  ORF type:complete len:572 (-),score=171.36 TRINITY_DN928_c1_g1_i7:171-1886(-)